MAETTRHKVERRKHPRKQLFLVMEVRGKGGSSNRLNVITTNISAGGVYFKTSHADEFEVGMATAFTIFMSTPTPHGRTHASRMEGSGRIVREETVGKRSVQGDKRYWKGVALEFDKPLKMF